MPLVTIHLRKGTSIEYRASIASGVHRALVQALQIPEADRFQIIQEHDTNALVYDPEYLGVQRSDKIVFVQITLSAGRKPAQKRRLYQCIVENLAADPGIRLQDVLIVLTETLWENWSFGNGEAQYTT